MMIGDREAVISYLGIAVNGLRKSTRDLNQDSQCRRRGSNQVPPGLPKEMLGTGILYEIRCACLVPL